MACLLLSGCFGPRDTLVREPVVPDQLQKVSDRISDEAIRSDRQVIEGLRVRLRKLNEQGGPWPIDNYFVCKAQAWIDFSEIEYTDNDRGKVVDHALDQARSLIEQMEANAKDISRDTPIIPESMLVRKDLWDFVAQRKAAGGPQCTDCDLARLEVQLVATGHDHAELGWRHAASGVLASERLARAVKVGHDGCNIANADGPGPVMASAVAVVESGSSSEGTGPIMASAMAVSVDDLRVPVVVHFAYNKSNLSHKTAAILARVTQVLRAYPETTVRVIGHTDARGGDRYNEALSMRRAASVRSYLQSAGIPASRITDEGRGRSQPLKIDEPLIEAYALDRRVELRFDNLPSEVIKGERQRVDVQADH
jgi:outer membrane protein OmpA-like peptidoglycan-associated protein